jgi:Na+/glutamate symporter
MNKYGRKSFIVLPVSEALTASPSIKKSEKIKFSFFLFLLSVAIAIAFLLLSTNFQVKTMISNNVNKIGSCDVDIFVKVSLKSFAQ